MNSREAILQAVRAVAREPRPLPDVPIFGADEPVTVERFKAALDLIGGTWVEPPADCNLEDFIRARYPQALVFCSAVPGFIGDRSLSSVQRPGDLADVDVGIVRARFGVAETGSIFFSEAEYRVNSLGYLSQDLVALLDPADIIGNLHQVYGRGDFADARYAVLMSGPSATADIEGVLIRGAQGIRSLSVIPWPRTARI